MRLNIVNIERSIEQVYFSSSVNRFISMIFPNCECAIQKVFFYKNRYMFESSCLPDARNKTGKANSR